MKVRIVTGALTVALAIAPQFVPQVAADNLRGALNPSASGTIGAALNPLGTVVASQVANQLPVFSTSAGYTYEFNPQLDVYERSATTMGPLFSERAITVGKNKFNINTSYAYIKFDTFNGHDLNHLTDRTEVANLSGGRGPFRTDLVGSISGGPLVSDKITAHLDIEAQLFNFGVTYGLLENLDVNVDAPVLRTFVRSRISQVLPDSRCLGQPPTVLGAGEQSCDDFPKKLPRRPRGLR